MQQHLERLAEIPEYVDSTTSFRNTAIEYVETYTVEGSPESIISTLKSSWKTTPEPINNYYNAVNNRVRNLRRLTHRIRSVSLYNFKTYITGLLFI